MNLNHQYSQINSEGGKMRLNRSSLELSRPLAPFILQIPAVSMIPSDAADLQARCLVVETLRPEIKNLKSADRN